jgi:flagellar motor switch protein FliN
MGVEVPLAHAVVDHLLHYERPFAESRLQLTPVEWGVWTYLVLRCLEDLASTAPASVPHEAHDAKAQPDDFGLVLDRVGPDAFDPAGLGTVVTIQAAIRLGSTTGTARLWLPEPALRAIEASYPAVDVSPGHSRSLIQREYSSSWRALAGLAVMPSGLSRLRPRSVLPLIESRLRGTPQSPLGPIILACASTGSGEIFEMPAEPVENSGGRLVRITGPMHRERQPRDPLYLGTKQVMSSTTPSPDADPASAPLDVPVTLVVELGRVNLPLGRLADLKPGDMLELGRHSREPVELTSGGRLVARGELVLIDTELGVRVTHVFL